MRICLWNHVSLHDRVFMIVHIRKCNEGVHVPEVHARTVCKKKSIFEGRNSITVVNYVDGTLVDKDEGAVHVHGVIAPIVE